MLSSRLCHKPSLVNIFHFLSLISMLHSPQLRFVDRLVRKVIGIKSPSFSSPSRCVIFIMRYFIYPFQKFKTLLTLLFFFFAIIRLDDDYDMMMLKYKINCVNIQFSRNYFYCSCNKFLFI